MELSVVIPVYNEEKRIRTAFTRMSEYLRKTLPLYEIIIVDDGSCDQTPQILKEISPRSCGARVIQNKTNHGKGFAVRQGVLEATGSLIFFTDVDLSTPPEEIGKFIQVFKRTEAHVLIGSRNVSGSNIIVKQPWRRERMGRVFNWFVRKLTSLQFQDTQCGFKGFTREAAHAIFSNVRQKRFAFDVEVLLIAEKLGFGIEEVPITWADHAQSKIKPFTDGLRMFRELLEIRQAMRGFNQTEEACGQTDFPPNRAAGPSTKRGLDRPAAPCGGEPIRDR